MVASPSNNLTLKITPAPVTLELASAAIPIKRGARREIPFSIKRLYGTMDAVTVSGSTVPYGLPGIAVTSVTLAPGQTQGTLVLDVNNTAPTGMQLLRLQASVVKSGQALSFVQEVSLGVE
jgi:hypothetical protein